MSRSNRPGQIVRDLLARRGLGPCELFLTQSEGIRLPAEDGGEAVEAMSGFALTADGHVFGFWLGWDALRGGYVLDPLYAVDDPIGFAGDAEFAAARARLGQHGRGFRV